MKIEAIPSGTSDDVAKEQTQVVRFKITGPVDPSDPVVLRARELVRKTGSASMGESFEWALSKGVFVSEK